MNTCGLTRKKRKGGIEGSIRSTHSTTVYLISQIPGTVVPGNSEINLKKFFKTKTVLKKNTHAYNNKNTLFLPSISVPVQYIN